MTGLDISTILPELLLAIYALAALLAGAYLGKDRIARQILWASVAALLVATQRLNRLPPLTQAMAQQLIRRRVVVQDDAGLWKLSALAA